MKLRTIFTAIGLLLMCCLGATAQDLRQVALKILLEDLAKSGSTFSRDMLARATTASSLEDKTIRTDLQQLLDKLDDQRKGKTALWKGLTALGGDDVGPKKMDRLLREFIDWGRKATKSSGNYDLQLIIERSAKKAKMPTHRAQELLALVAGLGLRGEVTTAPTLPEKLGILVVGISEYPVDGSRFPGMLRTEEDINRQTRFRDIHLPVVAGLVAVLPETEGVRWTIDGPHPRLRPDCVLHMSITAFISRQRRRDITLHATLRISLGTVSGVRLYSTELEVTYDYALEMSDILRSQRRLDGFFVKLSGAIRDDIASYLKKRIGS